MRTARDAALTFLEALREAPANRAQARLLNAANRDLAALLYSLGEEERGQVYRVVSPAKAESLRAELVRMGHVRLDADTVSRIAAHLTEHLLADRPLGPAIRYFRPREPR
jgi:flagellar motor switch protein FliG